MRQHRCWLGFGGPFGFGFTEGRFLKYWPGTGKVRAHVDAVHAAPPKADRYTGEIATEVALCTGCACIIATVSRTVADMNRPPEASNREAVGEYRRVLREILIQCGALDKKTGLLVAPYLHLAIHGMADTNFGPYAVEVGTLRGGSCSEEVRGWFLRSARAFAEELLPPETRVLADRVFVGDRSKAFHRRGYGGGDEGYGPHFNTVQIEISLTLREQHREAVIELLGRLVRGFGETFPA